MQVFYKVLSVDVEANCMEVAFSADGLPTVTVGTTIPLADESMDDAMRAYAPLAVWFPRTDEKMSVDVGSVGSVQATRPLTDPQEIAAERANSEMLSQVYLERRIAAALVKFGVLESDPTEIPAASL